MSELPHPIVAKAAESFGADPADDNSLGPISSSTRTRLLEIKNSQWRGGVWEEPGSGVCWLLVAGLAKGNHEDRDDFYKRVERENDSGDPSRWLPTGEDQRLLKRETAARLRTDWELSVQRQVLDALQAVQAGGTRRFEISHPVVKEEKLAEIDLAVTAVRDDGYEADEIDLEIIPCKGHAGSGLLWQLTVRTLITISPPEQSWDRFKDTYSNIGEVGAWIVRVAELRPFVEANELVLSEPGTTSHYAHREHLAGSTIEGHAVRGLCGVYFVPRQDHAAIPQCQICARRLSELPE
ncbi:DUF3039 domain-containing protein [Kribbella sp. DT2]|uniref:DUF3039 domain-containing protein n=1 Tax=Kribbella sp. DT2 TaxID=3393427 RepID=UPI003CE98CFA